MIILHLCLNSPSLTVDQFRISPKYLKENKKLSCRKETVRLRRGSVLAKITGRGYSEPNRIGLSSTTVT